MAQEIMVMGAIYEDVPSVRLPDSNGTYHPFTDTSDTTAIASDVAQGKVFHLADGSAATGTASGGGSGVSIYYGTCATAAATAAKVVVCEDFTSADLVEGTVINVKFTNAQTYNGAPTLNVNSTGAKNIKRVGTTNAARYEWLAGEVLQFVYDGSYWMLTDGGFATTTYYGVTKLSSSTSSTSTALAATPSAVKAAYDLANGKQDALVSGTNIKTVNGNSLLGSGDLVISGGGSGSGGVTVRGARVTVPNRTSTSMNSSVAVNGLDGVGAHDIVLFFGTFGYVVCPIGFTGINYMVHVSSSNTNAFDAFAAIISPNYEVGSQASIVGSGASLCDTTTPLVGDTVTITATSSAHFTVTDAASGGVYAISGTVEAGETYSFTVECATSYISVTSSGGDN